MKNKKRAQITALEAVDHLSHLADLRAAEKSEWLDPHKIEENQELIKATLRTLNSYLRHLYYKERGELEEEPTQKGLQAMMQLAGEAIDRVERLTNLFKGARSREEALPEYQQLQNFYLSKIFSKVKKKKPDEFSTGGRSELSADKQALKDLDAIREDREYELFSISQTDGRPFFSSELVRHIGLVGNFDETLLKTEAGQDDFFRRMDVILDRDLQISAQEIIQEERDLIERFFKEALHHQTKLGVVSLRKAVMALMLGANPKNLIHNTKGKSATDYFKDFEGYLREVIQSEDYRNWNDKKVSFNGLCLKLVHFLCSSLFFRKGARHEILEWISYLASHKIFKHSALWESLTSIKNELQQELMRYPSGPLIKTLELFRKEEEQQGFDPLLQNNPPAQIFTISSESFHTTVIHLPCPIHQKSVEKALVVAEFKGYLRSLAGQKHLYVNLQDRTSWKERSRCLALEALSEESEFSEIFTVMTLATQTDFYHQLQLYSEINLAEEFCRFCVEQLLSASETGFFFPQGVIEAPFVKALVTFIHQELFANKKTLNRKERLDFIEILYFFVVLKVIEIQKADVMNFSCKDGVDTGAAFAAEFYGFFRILSANKSWTEEDLHCLILTLLSPALLVRHRLIASSVFQRALSALEYFEAVMKQNRERVVSSCTRLFPNLALGKIKITEVA